MTKSNLGNHGVNHIPNYKLEENRILNEQIDRYLAAGGTIKVLPYSGIDKNEFDEETAYEKSYR